MPNSEPEEARNELTGVPVRGLSVPVRFTRAELEELDTLLPRFGASGRGHLLRMGLDSLKRQGGASKDELIRSAVRALQAALALPDGGGGGSGAAEAPAAPAPPVRCEYGTHEEPCNRAAEVAVTTRDGPYRLCRTCAEAPRFRRVRKRPIGAGTGSEGGGTRRRGAEAQATETPGSHAGGAETGSTDFVVLDTERGAWVAAVGQDDGAVTLTPDPGDACVFSGEAWRAYWPGPRYACRHARTRE